MSDSSKKRAKKSEDEDQHHYEAAASKILTRTQSMNIDIELANEVFDHFISQANTLKSILRTFQYLCDILRLKPQEWPHFYPKLKSKLTSWKAMALWAKFDKRASHKVYMKGKACAGQRILVIGAGPCGLRTAIEAQLLGAKVVVVEKRDRFSRNNVLHLWPYNIHDLRGLGAKKFFGKFCAGAIDHISIRALQCILLKVALLMGVEVFENCGFEDLVEPQDAEIGWKAKIEPEDHPVSQYEFDCLIGADGKRNTLRGFKRKEFRGKLAIAITANFINRHSEAESQIEEISGVAFIFNQKFFNDLYEAKGVDLENIVYYRDETHYFVMTAKKQSLIDKGVIIGNEADTMKLLSADNINQEKLFEYAREAADYATNYKMPHLDFAVNHYGKPDVAMFDFTSMFQAENSCRVIERHGHRLLTCLVGDSLLEPFWPTGTGCPRGFFGGLDAVWLMRTLASGKVSLLEALAERESIYRLLAQATPENTSKDFASYTVDPRTRYPNLNTKLLSPHQVTHLVDTDNPSQLQEELNNAGQSASASSAASGGRKRKESTVSPDTLLTWLAKQVETYEKIVISDMTTSFQNGLALCAIIHRYRPDLLDFHTLDAKEGEENLQLAFDILEQELSISPVIKASELANISKIPDKLTMMSYLSQVYECFRREIPALSILEGIPEDEKLTIGQMVAKKAAKKQRRSNFHDTTKEDIDQLLHQAESNNKENVSETARLNRSANRKRLLNLMQRAEASANDKKKAAISSSSRKSIKDEERYKVIEQLATGRDAKRRSGENSLAKYRENKKPKELKRAIGKIDKDDWYIKNIEEKLVINNATPDTVKKDKVPKWSKAAFQDKFNIMKGKLENSDGSEKKDRFSAIDAGLARLQKKLREGSTLETGERGSNRVSAMAEEMSRKDGTPEVIEETDAVERLRKKSSLGSGSSSENCHFCKKRVYVVERMSAEGKFFHRSCFRCDYCNILLRLGSYVYHRDNTPFSGRFFCIPHSTENALEKYRYRKKADEIKDAEKRKYSELLHRTNQEWSSKNSYINHHMARFDSKRGATPERAEFEASINQDSQPPSIMDEDEWTEQNFGNSLVLENEEDINTSEDDVTDLDSDLEEENGTEDKADRPLTAKEARQLQKEWLKRYDDIRNISEGEEKSQYDNVKDHSSSEDDDEADADYEDSEYESVSTDSELEEGCSNIKLAVPLNPIGSKRKKCPHHKKKVKSSSDNYDDDDDDSEDDSSDSSDASSSSDDDESESEKSKNSLEFSGSESNSECDFTDSEGRPNPFHKELEVPRINVDPGSPEVPGMRRYPEDIIEANTAPKPTVFSATRFQYKTPNLVEDLAKTTNSNSSSSIYVGRSTQRAFNLKKHWVSTADNSAASSSNPAKTVEKSEIDNRLKSLMDRLSNQQKLLKPADKPSTEMEYFMKRTTMNSGLKSVSTDPLITSPLKSPAVIFSHQKFNFQPTMSNGVSLNNILSNSVSDKPEEAKIEDFKEVESIPIPDVVEEPKKADDTASISSSSSSSSESPNEEQPPPIPPIPDIYIAATNDEEHDKTTFESCNETTFEDEANYKTPANDLSLNPEDLNGSENIPLADDEEDFEQAFEHSLEPLANSTPDIDALCSPTESEKSFIQKQCGVKLTDDEIMRIYKEQNPIERLAKFNSLKRKQSSVIHDMILSHSANKPRTRRTRVAVPSSSIPIPSELNQSAPAFPRTPLRAMTEPPPVVSLPATPLTDPAKFGIPVSRNQVKVNKLPASNSIDGISSNPMGNDIKSMPQSISIDKLDGIISSEDGLSLPNSPAKSKLQSSSNTNNKKSLMQAISGIFRGNSNTRMASPEDSLSSPPSCNSESRKSRSDTFMKFLKQGNKKSPNANGHEDSKTNLLNRRDSRLSMKASHPSTPPVPLSRKITITRTASEESLSDLNEDEPNTSGESSLNFINGNQVPPEILEKLMKRGGKSAKRAARVAHLKRVRKAQEIQRQLEELDVMHKELEDKGIEAEKCLRGESNDFEENDNPELLQAWFHLLAEKNALVRHEQELLVQAKQLELEDKSGRLEAELREHLLLDSRSTDSVAREAHILQELLSIAEQREMLQNMLERDKKRYQKEDQDIEVQMKAKGLRMLPMTRKLSLDFLYTSSTA